MPTAIAAAWGLVLVLCTIALWIRWRRRNKSPFTTRSGSIVDPPKMAAMPNAGDALVCVNEDGSVRKLTDDEKRYVETEFSPFDGARPLIKSRYRERTAWGIRGYLPRAQVPDGVAIDPAPPQSAPGSS